MRFGALIVAVLFSSLQASAAQITISGTYEVTSLTTIAGTPGQGLGDKGSWVFDVQWNDETNSSTQSIASASLGFTPLSGAAWEYNALKGGASPAPEMSTSKLGANTLWNVDDFSFDPASVGVIGNTSAILDYQAITDASVNGTALSQVRVQEIIDQAFQSEGILTTVTVDGADVWLSQITLYGPTVVPEPSSIGLFALLAAGAGIVYRRRRSA